MNFEPFLRDIQIVSKLSPTTVRAYRNDMELFEKFANERSVADVSQIDPATIREYIEWLRKRKNRRTGAVGCADASVARRLAALSTYIDFMRVTCNSALPNPLEGRSINRWRKNNEPKPVEEWSLDLLLSSIPSERDRVLFRLAVASGLRVSEIKQLDRDSINFEVEVLPEGSGRIFAWGEVIGKGNKRRKFYIDSTTTILLAKYLESRIDTVPALFISQRMQRLSVRAIEERLGHWCKKFGFRHINVHRLRHTFATRLANAHISSAVLKELMGHKSYNTTQQYFKLTDNTLAQGYHAAMEYYRDENSGG